MKNQRKKYGMRIVKIEDLRRLVAKIIQEIREGDIETERARAIFYGCNTLVKIFEVAKLEEIKERIKVLEEK